MKTAFAILVALCVSTHGINAQTTSASSPTASTTGQITPTNTLWTVVSKSADEQVLQRIETDALPSGQTVQHIHQYVELATGMHYWEKGQWQESQELIESFPGGAIARQGQHKVIFANNPNTAVAIDMETSDGQRLRSHVLGLSYYDTASGQSVLIAEVKDSWGQLYSPNVVIYPDAFTDFKADVRYTYTRAGFEQDIILHERPLGPEAYGLDPATTRLQVLTEFLNPPQPKKWQKYLKTAQGDVPDEELDFGAMHMGRGKAFALEREGGDIPVSKQWLKLEGRDFLVEEVAVPDIEEELQALPAAEGVSLNPAAGSVRHVVSKQRRLPAAPLVQAGTNAMQLAGLSLPAHGLVLDYVTFNSNQTNYTFQADTTYYISGSYYSVGTNTFEGGTVLKFATNGSISIVTGPGPTPSINWKAGVYRPVIFTAKDDNSVGESIGSGNPTGYYGNPMLLFGNFSPGVPMTGLRMSYAKTAIQFGGASGNIYDAQFINCQNGLLLGGATVFLGNALFANTANNFVFQGGSTVNAQNATFSGSFLLAAASSSPNGNSLALTNCILANVTNLVSGLLVSTNGNYNGFYNSPLLGAGTSTNTFYPFQAVGAGNYYLTNGCSFTNVGTSTINSTLLADLRKKTTYPPLLYSNLTISMATNFSPRVQRDTDALDLGYHYDPIDYIADLVVITNAALTVTNGAVIASYNRSGIQLQTGSSIVSMGSPTVPNRFVRYQSVQEQSVSLGSTNPSSALSVNPNHPGTTGPTATFRFTQFACPASGGSDLYDAGSTNYSSLLVQDCEFWGGQNNFTGATNTTATLKNNLFYRSAITAAATNLTATLNLTNNLVFGGPVTILQPTNNIWSAFNNDFDSCTITNSTLTNGYNAYLNCSGRLYPTNSHDVVSSSTLAYLTSYLGAFYQPTNSALIDKGNTNASLLGLYHYTTQTNQVKETNSLVDIGYHYVATDSNGLPLDSNGDGIPDYWQDANGNGLVDNGETNWGLAILTQPVSQTVPQGTNVTFAVTAKGIAPLSYKWYFNSGVLTNAANATLTLTNVQAADAGSYFVVVSNSLGLLTSSNATLTVLMPPVIALQPTNQIAIQGSNVTFSMIVSSNSTLPLSYQWYFNGTNLLAEATNSTLTLTNVQTSAAGNYSVIVANVAGSATSSNAALTVWVAFPMVAIGGERIMQLTTNGDVISWGGNQFGEFGDYTHLDSTNPVHVVGLTNITKIASSLNYSLAIDSMGVLWAWGQLDNEDQTNLPVQVLGMTNTIAIAVFGQTGGGTTTTMNVSGKKNMIATAAYGQADAPLDPAVAVKSDGTVWMWGASDCHNYGSFPVQIAGLSNVVSVAAGNCQTFALMNDGTVWTWGNGNETPASVSGLSNIVAICAGSHHTLALASDSTVWAWGLNSSGQLGDGGGESQSDVPVPVAGLSNVVAIAAGYYHSLALDAQGRAWAWGANNVGQLGAYGFDMTNLPVQVVGLTNIISIAAGSDASVALDSNGNLWQWGASDSDGTNWVWGDENGLPALAPQYIDFYNGQLPNLTITNGNNQTPHAGVEFQQPLVFRVTDTNGMALSNAPVSVEVIAGDMELRTVSGWANYKGLRLTTDSNGEVSLIGYADRYFINSNCLVRVLAASREQVAEVDFNETLIPLPTISITSPLNGSTNLVGTNQGLNITVDAEAALGSSIQEVDYYYQINGGDMTLLGTSVTSPFTFAWTNAFWWSNAFVGQYTLSAVAVDDAGAQSDPTAVNITVALDTDGNGMPDYWQLEFFGHLGVDPNADADGDGINNLQEYQNSTDPTDYYNGVLPKLALVDGDRQIGDYDSFLPGPLTVRVTDVNDVALSNAPVEFVANNGVVELVTDDSLASTLTLRTDGNGQVSVWGYCLPDNGLPNPDSIVVAQALSAGASVQVSFNELVARRLGYWRFNPPSWLLGEDGQNPVDFANVTNLPDWSGYAVAVDNPNPAYLTYSSVEAAGNANIVPWNGAVRFWFRPDWNSATVENGTGPGTAGRLIELGSQNAASWWTLLFSADGTQLNFITQTNGVETTNLNVPINWSSNDWHQIVLTFGQTNSELYLDGQAVVTDGLGVSNYPDATAVADGFNIGSDNAGNNQARGQFDELEIFNYQPSTGWIENNYTNYPVLLPTIQTQPVSQTGYIGGAVTFTVTAGGGSPLNYQWYFNGSPLANATNTTLPFTSLKTEDAGSYAVVVANSLGSVTSSNAVLTLLAPLTVAITSPTNHAVAIGSQADISLTASANDIAGSITGIEFFDGSTSLGTATSTPYNLVWNAPAGNHTLTAIATDSNGYTATSSVVNLIITLAAVSITNPADGTLYICSQTNIALSATASDVGGTISQVEFFQGSSSLGVVTTEPYDLTWTNASTGFYALTAVATDNSGFTATSSIVNITITPLFETNNLRLWLKGDAITGVDNNASLATWPDSSGWNNNPYQDDTDWQPHYVTNILNGLPAVQFSGTGQYFEVPYFMSDATSGEAFVVLQTTTEGGTAGCLWNFGNVGTPKYPEGDGSIQENFGSTNTLYSLGVPSQPLNQFHVYEVSSASGNWAAWINGMLLFQANNNTVGFNNSPTIGRSAFVNFKGNVAEVLVFDHALTNDERTIVNGYLNAKYGLMPVVPAPPADLTATAISQTQISLKWNEALNGYATRVSIERLTAGTWTYQVVAQITDATTYVDTNLAPGTTYYYRVRSSNLAAWSDYSDVAQATTLANGIDLPLQSLALWLKADSGLVQGNANTPVNLWVDQSGNGNNATQPAGDHQPLWVDGALNGRPVVRFDGSSSYLNLPNFMNGATSGEAFVVLKTTTPSEQHGGLWLLGSYPTSVSYPQYPNDDGSISESFGSTNMFNFFPGQPLNQYHVYEVASENNNWEAWINGTVVYQTRNNTVGFNSSSSHLGLSWSYFQGDIAEVMVFNRVLTGSERATVAGYLNGKYAAAPPVVSILNPANNAVFTGPTNITITAAASDDAGIGRVELFEGTNSLGVVTNVPYSLVWSNVVLGSYSLTARAQDNNGLVFTSAVVNVTVGGISITTPTNNQVLVASADVPIEATAIEGAGISQVEFFQGTTSLGVVTNIPYALVWSNVTSGTYALTAVAQNSYGQTSTSSVVSVTVDAASSVTLTAPANDDRFAAGTNITFGASVSDPDGTVAQVEFFEGSNSLGVTTSSPYNLVWAGVPSGSYALTARATDNSGLVSTSAVVNIVVAGISITNPANNMVLTGPTDVTIAAAVTDNVGISQVEFFQVATSLGIATSAPFNFTWIGVSPGTYALTAVATDSGGLVFGSSMVQLVVDSDPNNTDRDGDGISDYLEYLEGRNPLVGGDIPDTNGIINLQIYTPLQ